MRTIQRMPCPNCGCPAERHQFHTTNQLVRTQCRYCNYLLITCAGKGRGVAAYAPGICASI